MSQVLFCLCLRFSTVSRDQDKIQEVKSSQTNLTHDSVSNFHNLGVAVPQNKKTKKKNSHAYMVTQIAVDPARRAARLEP